MSQTFLSRVLWLDALSCAVIFIAGAFASVPVADLLGLPSAVLAAGGWICLAAGALLAVLALLPVRSLLALAIAGNAAWVAASFAVWLVWFDRLTLAGHAVLIAQAAAVALFVALELRGYAALRITPASARG